MPLRSPAVAIGLAVLAILPLLGPQAWSGLGVGLVPNSTLSALSPLEQPLSTRTLTGVWALVLPIAWFALVYRSRDLAIWEAPLVMLGTALAVMRTGNVWLEGLAVAIPLARQARRLAIAPPLVAGLGLAWVALTAANVLQTRPRDLPLAAVSAAAASHGEPVFANWQWAGDLQRQLGANRPVIGAAGLHTASDDYWSDYLRVSQAHLRWSSILQSYGIELVVLDAAGAQQPIAELIRSSPGWRVLDDSDGALVAERIRAP